MNDGEGTIGRRLLAAGMRALGFREITPAPRTLEEAVAAATVDGATIYAARIRSAIEYAPDADRPALGVILARAENVIRYNRRVVDRAQGPRTRRVGWMANDPSLAFARTLARISAYPVTLRESRALSRILFDLPRTSAERRGFEDRILELYAFGNQRAGVGVDDPSVVPWRGEGGDMDDDEFFDSAVCPGCGVFHSTGQDHDGEPLGGEDDDFPEPPDPGPLGDGDDGTVGEPYDYARDDFEFDAARERGVFGGR